MPHFTTLAAGNPDYSGAIGAFIVIVFIAAIIGVLILREERRKRAEAEQRLDEVIQQARQQSREGTERDNIMFTQHKQMNDLQIAKLTAEVELLQNQVKAKALDEDRIEASKEYHELMVEKTRLEMDSLRLHLLELRKRARTEDWRSED